MSKEFYLKNKLIGKLSDDGIYRKAVNSKKHKMHIYDGYGIEESIIKELKELNCKEIRIAEIDTGKLFKAPFSEWEEHGIVGDFQTVQRFLPIKHLEQYSQV